jgi:PAS domain S-box-containing protein
MNEYLQLFQILPFPAILIEPKKEGFYIKDVNERFLNLMAEERDALLSKKYPEVLQGSEFPQLQEADRLESLNQALETGEMVNSKLFISSTSGEEKYWQVQIIPLKNDLGKVEYLLNLGVEKTTEIAHEKARLVADLKVKESSYREEHFVHQNSDCIYSLDRFGNFTNVNEGLVKLAELPEEEILEMNFLSFCNEPDQEKIIQNFEAALAGERQHFDGEFISASGKKLVLLVTLMPIQLNGVIEGVYGIAKDITALRTTEKELEKKQRTFEALVEEGSDLTVILSLDAIFTFVSKSTMSVLGTMPDFYLEKCAYDFIHPEDVERVRRDLALLKEQSQVKLAPYRFANKNGNYHWIETRATNLVEDPYVEGIVANSREVTELVRSNIEIKKLYERYELAAAATKDLIYDWDLEQDKMVRFCKGGEKIFGYDREEINHKDFWREHIHPQDLVGLKELFENTLINLQQNEIKVEYRFRRADGSYAHLIDRSHVVRNSSGRAIRLIGATSDISALVEKRNALKNSNKRFNYVLMATKEMIWDWDIQKNEIKRSRTFIQIFGSDRQKDASAEDFWLNRIIEADREPVRASVLNALRNDNIRNWQCDYAVIRDDGELVHLADRGFIIRDKAGKAVRMVGAALDVSESKRLLQEVKKQNKLLKDVAWEQSHVVRAPLARLKGLLELYGNYNEGAWSREELWHLILESADELDHIIKNIVKKTERIGVGEP